MLEALHTLVDTDGRCNNDNAGHGDGDVEVGFNPAAAAAEMTHVRCEQCWAWSLRSSCGEIVFENGISCHVDDVFDFTGIGDAVFCSNMQALQASAQSQPTYGFHSFAGLPSRLLKGSWYCRACVQENDAAAAAARADALAAAKSARNLIKKGKSKGID